MVYSYYFCDNTSKKGEFTFHHCCDRTERENDTWYGPNKIKNSKELSLCVISSTYLALRLSANTSIIDSRRSLWYFTSYTLLIYLRPSY